MAGTEILQKWLSTDRKEAIIVLSGDYWLVQLATKDSQLLGKSAEEAMSTLAGLNKREQFADF